MTETFLFFFLQVMLREHFPVRTAIISFLFPLPLRIPESLRENDDPLSSF